MIATLTKTLGGAVAVLGGMASLAGAANMTCTQEPQTVFLAP